MFLAALTALPAQAQEPPAKEKPAPPAADSAVSLDVITPEMRKAVEQGLDWLGKNQNPDGSYGSQVPVAATSIAGLALLAGGNLPGRGKYGSNVLQAIRYLVKRAQVRVGANYAYFTETGPQQGGSRMHGHGFATLFLAEAYGMIEDYGPEVGQEALQKSIQKAIHTIEQSQSSQGGWYYEPELTPGRRMDADEGSVTVTQIQALRSARNSGFRVDRRVIDKAIEYIRRSANADGGIRYSLSNGGQNATFALTGAGVSVMQFLGRYDMPEVQRGLEYLMRGLGLRRGGGGGGVARGGHFSYENFYAVIALYQAGGEYWSKGFPILREAILRAPRQPNGAWEDNYGEHLGTAFAVLTLEVPLQYLPIFQR